ncbi:MAG: 50S ribosomal protein L7/L12 [Ureaplasma sp.]|nr:50S ribosomal protein L7/L12 [Ureaplasma sp.]MDE5651607.1 50S ribosomal protein L7/L12 [Ureaplasma sp.]MDE7221899.1 50S ribosomal protein L7/L12 [Ureaplasma sp.]
MAKLTNEQIIESLKEMSILEVNDLIKAIETEFGVSAAAPVAVAAAGAASADAPSDFNVVLVDAGANKVGVIKLIREITGLGLMEAKQMSEKSGSVIKEGVKTEDANNMKKQFEEIGAKVELK